MIRAGRWNGPSVPCERCFQQRRVPLYYVLLSLGAVREDRPISAKGATFCEVCVNEVEAFIAIGRLLPQGVVL